MSPDLTDIARSPEWHLFDIDPENGRATLLHLTEADYRAASFLDERAAAERAGLADRERQQVALKELRSALASDRAPAPSPHLIFHLGHCGSTLLSRALAAASAVLPVREPLTLRRLAPIPAASAEPAWREALDMSLRAHARVFRATQVAVIKATSVCNRLIAPVLRANPHSRAILMYVPLDTYLAGMLGKAEPAVDLRGHAATRLADWNTMEAAPAIDIEALDEAGLAVLAWLTGMRHLLAAAENFPARSLLLEFESFLDDPESGLRQAATFLGLEGSTDAIIAGWPDISTGYSKKPDEPYSAFNRRRTLARGRTRRGAEIEAGMTWARKWVADVPDLKACAAYLGAGKSNV